MENISRHIDCSCPIHSLILFETLSFVFFFHAFTKNEFLCLVTMYKQSYFPSSQGETLALLDAVDVHPGCTLPHLPHSLHIQLLLILWFHCLQKHNAIMRTWNKQCYCPCELNLSGSIWTTTLSSLSVLTVTDERAQKVGYAVRCYATSLGLYRSATAAPCLSATLTKEVQAGLLECSGFPSLACHQCWTVVKLTLFNDVIL